MASLFAEAHEWGRSLIQSERLCLGNRNREPTEPKTGEQPKTTKAANQAKQKARQTADRARQDTTRTNPNQTTVVALVSHGCLPAATSMLGALTVVQLNKRCNNQGGLHWHT